MSIKLLGGAFVFSLCAAILAAFFINPFSVNAVNTASINTDRGSSQYLEAADSSSLSVTNNFTLEAWVKFASLPEAGGASMNFISHWDSSVNQKGFIWRLREDSGSYVLDFSNSPDGVSDSLVSVPWTPTINSWYHVAVSFSSGSVKFYVNGVQQGSTQISSFIDIFDNTVNLNVASLQGSNDILNGKLDDVRIWNVVRTQPQIAANYNQELVGNESGLVTYWQLNNNLSDSTTNGNTLSLVNGPTFSSDIPFVTPPPFTEVRKARKSVTESVTSSNTLQNDDHLKLSLAANKTYIIDGVIFATAGNGTPDLKMQFSAQPNAQSNIGYSTRTDEEVLVNGTTSGRIAVSPTAKPIHVHGTIVTGSTSGDFQLKWAQNTSNANATSVLVGSYLRAEEI